MSGVVSISLHPIVIYLDAAWWHGGRRVLWQTDKIKRKNHLALSVLLISFTPAWWHRRRLDTSLLCPETLTVSRNGYIESGCPCGTYFHVVSEFPIWNLANISVTCFAESAYPHICICARRHVFTYTHGWNEFRFHQESDTNAKLAKTSMALHIHKGSTSRESREVLSIIFHS